ncbi:hypothetical protein HS088_TW14G01125 [Tripterygium wilfordii]|uniref:Uncharacterized protein n=1 Tax=Tripterygium wilfordii TaxID=458696 RepID=A0A7J7CSB0_TRIWF|nr:hypothetical protein HS088_TW14G01125 [Tripterygium wilfordii]
MLPAHSPSAAQAHELETKGLNGPYCQNSMLVGHINLPRVNSSHVARSEHFEKQLVLAEPTAAATVRPYITSASAVPKTIQGFFIAKMEPNGIVVLHQADIGEYLRTGDEL